READAVAMIAHRAYGGEALEHHQQGAGAGPRRKMLWNTTCNLRARDLPAERLHPRLRLRCPGMKEACGPLFGAKVAHGVYGAMPIPKRGIAFDEGEGGRCGARREPITIDDGLKFGRGQIGIFERGQYVLRNALEVNVEGGRRG